jgi:hypothetical protein
MTTYRVERIVRAAIRVGVAVISVPRPGRHHHVISLAAENAIEVGSQNEQGFLTSEGRFVDRAEGLLIAQAANQIGMKDGETSNPHLLFSEDLW